MRAVLRRIWEYQRLKKSWQYALACQKANHILDCIKRSMTRGSRGGDSVPLLFSRETPPIVLHPFLRPSTQELHKALEQVQRRATEVRGLEHLPYRDRLRELSLFSLKRRHQGDLIAACQYLKGASRGSFYKDRKCQVKGKLL